MCLHYTLERQLYVDYTMFLSGFEHWTSMLQYNFQYRMCVVVAKPTPFWLFWSKYSSHNFLILYLTFLLLFCIKIVTCEKVISIVTEPIIINSFHWISIVPNINLVVLSDRSDSWNLAHNFNIFDTFLNILLYQIWFEWI